MSDYPRAWSRACRTWPARGIAAGARRLLWQGAPNFGNVLCDTRSLHFAQIRQSILLHFWSCSSYSRVVEQRRWAECRGEYLRFRVARRYRRARHCWLLLCAADGSRSAMYYDHEPIGVSCSDSGYRFADVDQLCRIRRHREHADLRHHDKAGTGDIAIRSRDEPEAVVSSLLLWPHASSRSAFFPAAAQ